MAVYTDVAAEDLAEFLKSYDIGELLSYKGIAEGVENSNFLLHTSQGAYILTLYEKRVAEGDLPYFLSLMAHLAERGVSCPQPARNRKGEVYSRLAGRPAAIINFLEGMWPRRPSVAHCSGVGAALAKMHLAGRDFPLVRNNPLSVSGWRPLFDLAAARADSVQPGLHDFIARELDHLEAAWPADLPVGVIHADLFPDNVFFLGDKVSGLIDFPVRLQRHPGLRRRDLPQRLVLRAGSFLQRHQGPRAAQCLWPRAAIVGGGRGRAAAARARRRAPFPADAPGGFP